MDNLFHAIGTRQHRRAIVRVSHDVVVLVPDGPAAVEGHRAVQFVDGTGLAEAEGSCQHTDFLRKLGELSCASP